MKNGLLVCKGTAPIKNIGDYIQSLASELFFDKIDDYIEREELAIYDKHEQIKLIIHGWFMWKPEMWPPSENIVPLITSLHIVPEIAEDMLASGGKEYLKQFEPIGCRDFGTMEFLQKKGIDAYYSSCLTLVLGERYKSEVKSNKIIFVDPYFEYIRDSDRRFSVSKFISSLLTIVYSYNKVRHISKNIDIESELGRFAKYFKAIDKYLSAAGFYRTYSTFFEDEVLLNSEFIAHTISQKVYNTEESKFNLAKEYMNKYAQAKLVVTSRIHCALPCLAVETPVIFVESENLDSSEKAIRSKGRFGGIKELFRTLSYKACGALSSTDELILSHKHKFNYIGQEFNKGEYIKLKDALIKQCEDFVSSNK